MASGRAVEDFCKRAFLRVTEPVEFERFSMKPIN